MIIGQIMMLFFLTMGMSARKKAALKKQAGLLVEELSINQIILPIVVISDLSADILVIMVSFLPPDMDKDR